ncbi:MAG: copper chaperone PCu(A)C [Chloroflexota bacterium]
MFTKKFGTILLMLILLLTLGACGSPTASEPAEAEADMEEMSEMEDGDMDGMDHSDDDMDHGDHGDGMMMMDVESSTMDAMGDGFEVIEVFGRAVPAVSETSAFYMTISNGTDTDEVLQSATVEMCGLVELHEMMMDGDVMMMQEVDGGEIVIPAGKAVMLQPGGLHVMCIDKDGDLAAGDTVPIILNFQNAGTLEVSAEIREIN